MYHNNIEQIKLANIIFKKSSDFLDSQLLVGNSLYAYSYYLV